MSEFEKNDWLPEGIKPHIAPPAPVDPLNEPFVFLDHGSGWAWVPVGAYSGFSPCPKLGSPDARRRAFRNDEPMSTEHDYVQAKAAWLRENPGATPEQIERACQEIAERLGV